MLAKIFKSGLRWCRSSSLTVVLCLLASLTAMGQSGPNQDLMSQAQRDPGSTSQAGSRHRAPLHHLYWYFLRFQRHIDERAAMLEQQGQAPEAARLRYLLQKELHFSNAQAVILREAGLQMEKDADAIWAKAMPIMLQDREWRKLNGRSAGPPPGHALVNAWQEERETVIKNAVARLNRRLGPTAAARLQAHIETEFAPRVTVHQLPPRPHHPKFGSETNAPYRLEPQQ
jgi:hypothetical protein